MGAPRLTPWTLVLAWCGLAPATAVAQSGAVVVRVWSAEPREPLPNAEVIDLDTGRRHFTDESGLARVPVSTSEAIRIRVRQLGFRFQERTLASLPSSPHDTAQFVLERIAWALPSIATTSSKHCPFETDSATRALSAWALEQLRYGAERYREFRNSYPFEVRVVRRTAYTNVARDSVPMVRQQQERERSERWGAPYQPGRVIERSERGFSVPILFIAALADSLFWEHHCFAASGMEGASGRRVVRLRFYRAPGARDVDWEGAALIDSATSILRRVEFRLAGLDPSNVPKAFEGYTAFAVPSPYIVIPDTTVAMWWRRERAPDADWGPPDVAQMIYVDTVRYRRQKPPR
jgi:hypothetical protein